MTDIKSVGYVFFWDGVFSNFHPIGGNQACTSEKFYMLQKAVAFHDTAAITALNASVTPMSAKKIGRSVQGYDDAIWNKLKIPAMMAALHFKYAVCPEFRDSLRSSGSLILVEASPYDRIWGIGFRESEALANIDKWGENLLGKCLMDLRKHYFGS